MTGRCTNENERPDVGVGGERFVGLFGQLTLNRRDTGYSEAAIQMGNPTQFDRKGRAGSGRTGIRQGSRRLQVFRRRRSVGLSPGGGQFRRQSFCLVCVT